MIQWSESEYTDNTDVDAAPRAANPTACQTAPRSLRARVISSICIFVFMPFVSTLLPTTVRVGKSQLIRDASLPQTDVAKNSALRCELSERR